MSLAGDRIICAGRPTRAEIDLAALKSNIGTAMDMADGRKLMAVVKADAYGHGAVRISTAALSAGASCLGVATVGEAAHLREEGIDSPVVILSEVPRESAADVVRLGCSQVVYTLELAEALERAAAAAGAILPVHIKVDTGMGRVGLDPSAAPSFARRLEEMPHLSLRGLLSHLADADDVGKETTARQTALFEEVCRLVEKEASGLAFRHIANSALVMRGEAVGNMVRPGIMLYGSPPAPGFRGWEKLKPVMKFVTAIAYLKSVPAGTPLSYGGTIVTTKKSLIATLPVGYADGYPRLLSNRASVLVRGRRAPQVGRVCMDMTLVDVSDIPDVTSGDEVVLMGRQGDDEINADELAGFAETISYEIYCGVSRRVPRVFLPEGRGD